MVYSADQIEHIVQDYLGKTLTRVPDIEEVWLFGSYNNGTPNDNSDVDLAIVSERFADNLPVAMIDFYEAVWEMKVDVSIQVHGFTRNEFANSTEILAQEVKRTGKRLYPVQ